MKRKKLIFVLAVSLLALGGAIGAFIWIDQERLRQDSARITVTQTLIVPLDAFNDHLGRYPKTDEGLEVLFRPPVGESHRWRGPYIDGRAERLTDPWGNPYGYRYPAEESDRPYDLFSLGSWWTGVVGNW